MNDVHVRSVGRHRGLITLTAAVATMAVVGAIVRIRLSTPPEDAVLGGLGMVVFTAVGALILDRRPDQPIGRLCLAIGLLLALGAVLQMIVLLLIEYGGESTVIWARLAVISSALGSLAIFLAGPMLIGWFPDGRVPGWRTRVLTTLVAGVVVSFLVVGVTRPGRLDYRGIPAVPNPFAVPGIIDVDLSDRIAGIGAIAFLLAYVLASADLLWRYRKAGRLVRAQIRWFRSAIGVSLVLVIGVFTIQGPLNHFLWGSWILSLLLTPVAIAVAITRYRLYDIDRIISRTIGYGIMSVVLLVVFAGGNLALQSAIGGITRDDPVVVAASTLSVAALFNPVRSRVQSVVDRRFNRARYDAERTVAVFAGRMRDQLDLPTLTEELHRTIVDAVQPSTTAACLRTPGSSR